MMSILDRLGGDHSKEMGIGKLIIRIKMRIRVSMAGFWVEIDRLVHNFVLSGTNSQHYKQERIKNCKWKRVERRNNSLS